jgi:heme-degrading monooxygenase HmoA
MITHIVMWRVRGDTTAERNAAARTVQRAFESLRGRIPGMRRLEVGIDVSRCDYACDVVLVSEFDSRDALAAYADHPEHLRVRAELGDLRIARHQVDYEAQARGEPR